MRRWTGVVLLIINLGFGAYLYFDYQQHRRLYPAVLSASPSTKALGGGPRLEREFKLGIARTEAPTLDSFEMKRRQVTVSLKEALEKVLIDTSLSAVKYSRQNSYRLTGGSETMLFRDVYFDTSDRFNLNNELVLRARHRWSSIEAFDSYLQGSRETQNLPHRFEIQSKFGRELMSPGLSYVLESRLDLSGERDALATQALSASPPWPLEFYLSGLLTGQIGGWRLSPYVEYAKYLSKRYPKLSHLDLRPFVAIYTMRTRFHLELPTRWGSGPNKDQVFIVSLDQYWAKPYGELEAISNKTASLPLLFQSLSGPRYEVEIEFERNTSEFLDRDLKLKVGSAQQAQKSFLNDLEIVQKTVQSTLRESGFDVQAVDESKYLQAVQMVDESQK